MPYEIPWEDAYWERRREEYDEGESWAIPIFDEEEDEDLDFLYDQFEDDKLEEG